MDPVQLVKQILHVLCGSCSLSLVGVALKLKCIAETNLVRLS